MTLSTYSTDTDTDTSGIEPLYTDNNNRFALACSVVTPFAYRMQSKTSCSSLQSCLMAPLFNPFHNAVSRSLSLSPYLCLLRSLHSLALHFTKRNINTQRNFNSVFGILFFGLYTHTHAQAHLYKTQIIGCYGNFKRIKYQTSPSLKWKWTLDQWIIFHLNDDGIIEIKT